MRATMSGTKGKEARKDERGGKGEKVVISQLGVVGTARSGFVLLFDRVEFCRLGRESDTYPHSKQ